MRAGVTVVDPATTWVDADVDHRARRRPCCPGVAAARRHRDRRRAPRSGPRRRLTDTAVGARQPHRSARWPAQAGIGADVTIGPFAYLRPGTVLADEVHIGTYVEIKDSEVGAGTKVPHLSYVGDATIGEHTNIGAATVFVNYDGVAKHRTVIGRPRPHRRRQHVRRAGRGRRRRLHRGRFGHHRGRAARARWRVGPRPPAQRGRLGGDAVAPAPQPTEAARRRRGPTQARAPTTRRRKEARADEHICKSAGRKSLMLFSGRAYPELADADRRRDGRDRHPDDRARLRQRRDLHQARRVGARQRRVRDPVLHHADQPVGHGER